MTDISQPTSTCPAPYDGLDPIGRAAEAARLIDVVLEGGPRHLPPEWRSQRLAPTDQKVKLAHNGGYEHFEHDGVVPADGEPVVFRWTRRTRVAE
ncbi:DUF5988 family protein [Micromonospora sp. CA-244673]|uniref:DUF5988 family protein n=1 Tax=Micromonospora sp. CA-244673 TaxID=3239958 RepID=UPI003D94D9E8